MEKMMQKFQETLELALKLVKLPPQELGMVIIMNWGKWVSPPAFGPSFKIPARFRIFRYFCDTISTKDCIALENFTKSLGDFRLETKPVYGEGSTDIAFKLFQKNIVIREEKFHGTMEGAGNLAHQILTLWANAHNIILFDGKAIKQKTA